MFCLHSKSDSKWQQPGRSRGLHKWTTTLKSSVKRLLGNKWKMPTFKALFVGFQNSVSIQINWKGHNYTHPTAKAQKWVTMGTASFPLPQQMRISCGSEHPGVHRAALYLLSQPSLIISGGGNRFWLHIPPFLYWHHKPKGLAGKTLSMASSLKHFSD